MFTLLVLRIKLLLMKIENLSQNTFTTKLMKLGKHFVILLLILLNIGLTSFQTLAAKDADSLRVNVDSVTVKQALIILEEHYKVAFFYDEGVVKAKLDKDVIVFKSSIEETLDNILSYSKLKYKRLDDGTYVISTKKDLKSETKTLRKSLSYNSQMEPNSNNVHASIRSGQNYSTVQEDKMVSGRVTDASTGSPIPGVSILIKNSNAGTISDADGNFIINVPSINSVLVFSFVGFEKTEVLVGRQTTIDVQLKEALNQLNEIVVTAIGVEANKRELGYSIQNVDKEELRNTGESNLVNSLSGKIAGVQIISSSGSPGASANIRIRGNKSVNGSNSPLFVVDGVPIDNSNVGNGQAGVDNSNRAIDINPSDIEKVTVLKGPAATSLYGIRAANGAILITTKRGESGKTMVAFSSSFFAEEVNKLPEFQNSYAQGRPVAGTPVWFGPETKLAMSYGPAIDDLEFDGSFYLYDKNGRLVPKGTGNGVPAKAYNNIDNFFITGKSWDNNVSVSGGNDRLNYYASIGNFMQDGVVPNSSFERTSSKLTIQANLTNRLSLSASGSFINSGGSRQQRGSNNSGVTLGLFRNSPTFDIGNGKSGQAAADDPQTYQLPDGTQRSYRSGAWDSPFWTVNKNPFNDNVNRFIGFINPTFQILPWLKAAYKLGVDNYADLRHSALDINSAGFPSGSVNFTNISSTDFNSDFFLLVEKDINSEIHLNATLGHNYYKNDFSNFSTTGNNLAAPGFYDISNAAEILSTRTVSRRKLYGLYGDFKFSFRDYLYLNLSARNDWSSTLPTKNNSFFYPSISVGFDFTQALSINNNPYLSYGKLRASYGQVGNDAPPFSTANYFGPASTAGDVFIFPSNSFPAFGQSAFQRSTLLGNDNLKAETTSSLEIGMDLSLFGGKLDVDITHYRSITTDQIINVNLPSPTGFATYAKNAGEIENSGLELALNARILQVNQFQWRIGINFSKFQTIVNELTDGVESIALVNTGSIISQVKAGQPYGALVGSKYARDADGNRIIGADGWPLVESNTDVIGNPNPDAIGGVRNTFSYKGLQLSFLWDLRKGGDMYNGTQGVIDFFGMSKVSGDQRDITGYVFDGVTESGSVNATPVDFANPANPAGVFGYKWTRYGFGGVAEDYIYDTSWARLREVSLSYSLPKPLVARLHMQNASITLTGRNLFLWTNYNGIDPETNLTGASNGFGIDFFNMPNTKSYGATVRITF